jgi:hypothetical protein
MRATRARKRGIQLCPKCVGVDQRLEVWTAFAVVESYWNSYSRRRGISKPVQRDRPPSSTTSSKKVGTTRRTESWIRFVTRHRWTRRRLVGAYGKVVCHVSGYIYATGSVDSNSRT